MLVPHLLKIYLGLGWPLSVLEIVSVTNMEKKLFCYFPFLITNIYSAFPFFAIKFICQCFLKTFIPAYFWFYNYTFFKTFIPAYFWFIQLYFFENVYPSLLLILQLYFFEFQSSIQATYSLRKQAFSFFRPFNKMFLW